MKLNGYLIVSEAIIKPIMKSADGKTFKSVTRGDKESMRKLMKRGWKLINLARSNANERKAKELIPS